MKQMCVNDSISLYRTRGSLLLRLKNPSDESGWREFYNLYGRMIFGYALHFNLSHAEAEDIVQEVVTKVFRQILSFDYSPERGRFRGWLKTVTKHAVIDFIRRRERRRNNSVEYREHIEILLEEPECREDDIWRKEREKAMLEVALQRVYERVGTCCRDVFELFVVERYSAREVGVRLDMEPNAVYACKHRMLKYIREEVEILERECGGNYET